MRGDHTGIPETCPMIDECVSSAKSAIYEIQHVLGKISNEADEDGVITNSLTSACEYLNNAFIIENANIEQVRDANYRLRALANKTMVDRDEKENEIDRLTTRLDDLEQEYNEIMENRD